jgi:hypothetical protein
VGPAHIELRLQDATTGEPVAGAVGLWCLDVPASADYTAGDLRIWTGEVPVGGVRIEGLPIGRYRLCLDDAALDAQDPAAFDLPAEGVRLDVALQPPAEVPLGIRIVPSDRREVIHVEAPMGTVKARVQQVEPAWIRRRLWDRQGVLTRVLPERRGFGTTWTRRHGLSLRAEQDDKGVWWVGRWTAPTRAERRDVSVSLRVLGGSVVSLRTDGVLAWPADGLCFVAASMPMAWIEDAVRLPDGRRAVDVGVKIRAHAFGRPLATDARIDHTELGITITVRDARYEPLDVTVAAGRRPDPIALLPVAADAAADR